MKIDLAVQRRDGSELCRYQVEQVTIEAERASHISAQLAHHVILIDRSSSMAEVMPELLHRLRKLLILEEYQDAQIKVSLLSYASQGDLITHCERATISELMARQDERAQELERLQSLGKTCISQALERALSLCQAGELTAISLHSDGFANDPRYSAERAALLSFASACREDPERLITLNTIAHSQDSDFTLLAELARLGSGRCVVARDAREVFEGLHHTTALISQPNARPYQVTHEGLWVMFSRADRLLLSGSGPQLVSGFGASSQRSLITYHAVDHERHAEDWEPLSALNPKRRELCVALSRAALSAGELNLAKWALSSSGSAPLITRHLNALCAPELGFMAHELEAALFGFELMSHRHLELSALPQRPTVLEILSLIHEHRDHVRVDLARLQSDYELRLQPLEKTAEPQEDGSTPTHHPRPIEGGDALWHHLRLNRSTATLNLTISYPVELVDAEGVALYELEGISLRQLRDYRTYSLVVNGELKQPSLWLHIESKALFRALAERGAVEGPYEPHKTYELRLKGSPIISERDLESFSGAFTQEASGSSSLSGLFERLARARLLLSAARALTAARSPHFTTAQLEALRSVGLSAQLNILTPQRRLVAAPSERSRPHRVIELGSEEHPSLTRLPSANALFQAQYHCERGGELIEKPRLHELFDGIMVTDKASTRATARRRLLKPLLDGLLGRPEGLKQLRAALRELAIPEELETQLIAHCEERRWAETESVELFSTLKELFEERVEELSLQLSPAVMYLGAHGLTPQALKAKLLSADALRAQLPRLKLSEREEAGMFLLIGEDSFLSITVEER